MSRRLKNMLSLFGRIKSGSTITATSSGRGALRSTSSEATTKYYIAKPHQLINHGRYETIRELGRGRYSSVWLSKDLRQNSFVAIKLLNSDCYGTEHDIFEIEILKTIARQQSRVGSTQSTHLIDILDTFQLVAGNDVHECIAMPVLGCSIGSQAGRFPGSRIPHRIVKQITKQLLSGLAFLHDECGVIHTDLQPSNICFEIDQAQIAQMADGKTAAEVTPKISEAHCGNVRIIDLGVASWIDNHLSDNIQPEHLRAPEVILGAPWGPPVDIWSLGCLVIEFVKGHVAFAGAASQHGSWTSEDDHLAQYMEILGPMPTQLLSRGSKTREYFDDSENLLRIPNLQITSLKDVVDGAEGPFQRPLDMSAEEALTFVDFLHGALALDPNCRKSATELLQHEWLRCDSDGIVNR